MIHGKRSWGLVAALAMLVARPARAQDALRGKRLFLDAATLVGSGVSCVDCHGGLPGGSMGIGSAANDPELVERAIDSIPQMEPFRSRLTRPDMADLAAYIGAPWVPSPQLDVTTWLPDGAAGLPDRISFGEIELEAASQVATLQIANTGQVGFEITTAPELAGDAAGEFSLAASDCLAGTVVAPARSCRLAVRFLPSGSPGPRTARVRVAHDWVQSPAAIALLGAATTPVDAEPDPPPASSPSCSASNGRPAWPWLAALVWCGRHRRRELPRPR